VPELEKAYPDPHVFGVMPSWGVFARHVKNLQVRDVELRVLQDEQRPAVVLDDVANARLFNVQLTGKTSVPLWTFNHLVDLKVRDCTDLPESEMPAVLPQRIQF
jgi:hypothetical protein